LVETRTQGIDRSSAQLIRHQFGNHLNSASMELDDKAQIISYEEYFPYGSSSYQAVRSQAETAKRYRYTGMERDDDTALRYHGTRYYAAWLGTWTSVDRLAHKFISQSPYCAMDNNPILKNDPTGTSGEVTIDKKTKTITVSAHLIFYGEAASSSLAKQTAADVQAFWNAAKGNVTIDGVKYNVQFKISGEYRDAQGPIDAPVFYFEKKLNKEVKNNFIEVKNKVAGGVSEMMRGGNEGTFQLNNIAGTGTTTEAHEFGHSLGLWPGTKEGHPKESDLRGKGQPGIMSARGTLVDPQYQYDPKAKAGGKGGTVNPNLRKVLQSDIDALSLEKLKYNNGKANLGKSTSSE
jgi:RHS repeat-associated protein